MFWEGLIGLYENKTKAFQVILRYCLDQEPLTWRDSLLTINTSTVSYSPSQSFHDYLSFTLESPGDLKPKIAIKNLPSESYLFFTEKWAWLFLESLHFILHFIFIDEVLLCCPGQRVRMQWHKHYSQQAGNAGLKRSSCLSHQSG